MWGLLDMDYNFTMKRFNGTDFDNLYPIGNLEQQNGVLPISKGGTGVTSVSALIDLVGQTGGAKIQTGTYTGTGTVGRSHPNSLTFQFSPKLLSLWVAASSTNIWNPASFTNLDLAYELMFSGVTQIDRRVSAQDSYGSVNPQWGATIYWSWPTNGVQWYSIPVQDYNYTIFGEAQANASGVQYHYLTIG